MVAFNKGSVVSALVILYAGLTKASQVVFTDAVADAPETGNIAYTLPTERTFLLNVPETYKHQGEPSPLVLSFHGGKPFLTVYAQGVNNTEWKMKHIWKGAPYENSTVDDIAYVYDIINTVSATYNVDRSRIYACGKSNGGGFTALLACRPDTSSIIAAFAPVSPALYQGTYSFHNCTPSRPVPIFHVHGVEDTITPFYGRTPEGGSFGPEPDVRVWRRQWAERNGCARGGYVGEIAQPASVEQVHEGAWEEVWDCPGAEVRSLSVEGLGHAWPSTLGLDLAGRPNHTANFNFTSQHLVQFFSRHALN